MKPWDYEIEFYEYDCYRACTPDGCPGHTTDEPIGIYINGIHFMIEEIGAYGEPCLVDKETRDNLKKRMLEIFSYLEECTTIRRLLIEARQVIRDVMPCLDDECFDEYYKQTHEDKCECQICRARRFLEEAVVFQAGEEQ